MSAITEFTAEKFGVEIEFKSSYNQTYIAESITNAGIECHSEGYNHITRDHWKIVYDASVTGGWELVSPPMVFGEEAFAQIETVCRVLAAIGARVDRQCGLHIHHDARSLTDKQIINIAATYAKHEDCFDSMMPRSRRGQSNQLLCSMVNGSMVDTVKKITSCKTREQLARLYSNRYHKLNIQSLFRHGTLEFRHHSGTVEAEKIINWVKITKRVMENGGKAKRVVLRAENPTWKVHRWLYDTVICSDLAGYVKGRIEKLA
jgi:hypothetical protein